eukprot:CAMPEP_0181201188 /NCGR_PEP_ID=MMETSP1096-20121128/18172_1 /TAXON_ID=156174 ORGANISM="Chrysochromulina ericina, Strain CCMP281" /NCGR_SAMPLE_ID=MMETSP1096 /ASSEMBLY_ACC=CAM_ASM_000453 /LENGTH=81 /DNA_ID=CAMNT_0023291611 /DNA_START=608 /DNA_END=856 /DNA_ORIENTATION=+
MRDAPRFHTTEPDEAGLAPGGWRGGGGNRWRTLERNAASSSHSSSDLSISATRAMYEAASALRSMNGSGGTQAVSCVLRSM